MSNSTSFTNFTTSLKTKQNVNRIFFSILMLTLMGTSAIAQDGYFQQGEFGFSLGASHYFGDLNTRSGLNRPKPAIGVFFRKQFGNYVGMRVSGHYAQVGYSDVYSKNEYQRVRNLSFNSNIFEFAVQGDFNFFKYVPDDMVYNFTPYVTLGLGVFSYDPYTFYNGEKYYLRNLYTEGPQNTYGTMAVCVPLGVGIKYSLNKKVNLSFEIAQRFTTTDYLDDVSTKYADASEFPLGPVDPNTNLPTYTPAFLLQDRSWEILGMDNRLSSVPGRQRGWSKQKDQYVIAEIGISFNLGSYKCPTAF